eukprot:m.99350 g.99350  ORF g.99350 m.99350 type:complete len:170 (-) comp20616_c0_seq1:122-631(-)
MGDVESAGDVGGRRRGSTSIWGAESILTELGPAGDFGREFYTTREFVCGIHYMDTNALVDVCDGAFVVFGVDAGAMNELRLMGLAVDQVKWERIVRPWRRVQEDELDVAEKGELQAGQVAAGPIVANMSDVVEGLGGSRSKQHTRGRRWHSVCREASLRSTRETRSTSY